MYGYSYGFHIPRVDMVMSLHEIVANLYILFMFYYLQLLV